MCNVFFFLPFLMWLSCDIDYVRDWLSIDNFISTISVKYLLLFDEFITTSKGEGETEPQCSGTSQRAHDSFPVYIHTYI